MVSASGATIAHELKEIGGKELQGVKKLRENGKREGFIEGCFTAAVIMGGVYGTKRVVGFYKRKISEKKNHHKKYKELHSAINELNVPDETKSEDNNEASNETEE